MEASVRRTRSLVLAVILGVVGFSLSTEAAQAKQGRIEFAKLVHRSDAPAGERTWLKFYTRGVHQADGGQVFAYFDEKDAEANQRPSPNTPYGVWTVTRESNEGRRLIEALRERLAHNRSASAGGIVFGPTGGGASYDFRLKELNKRVRAERTVIA